MVHSPVNNRLNVYFLLIPLKFRLAKAVSKQLNFPEQGTSNMKEERSVIRYRLGCLKDSICELKFLGAKDFCLAQSLVLIWVQLTVVWGSFGTKSMNCCTTLCLFLYNRKLRRNAVLDGASVEWPRRRGNSGH